MDAQSAAWDDLRIVLAIVKTGSLSATGRFLGTSHTTVFRRLGEIELRLGVRLFERLRSGYVPTPAGEEMASAAESIEAQVLAVERRIVGQDLEPTGTVRITTTDGLLSGFLTPILPEFQRSHPEIALEFVVSNERLNLSRRETDVAVRPTQNPPETLIGRRIAKLAHAIYTSTDRDLASPRPGDSWIDWDETMLHPPFDHWQTHNVPRHRPGYRLNTITSLRDAVGAGLGSTMLPCYLADGDARLKRLGPPIPELEVDLWLLIHPDLRRVARVRAVTDYIAGQARLLRDRFAGVAQGRTERERP
ncbi:LysR family transcriptional regulator [Labrys sp. KNU-23]|uniref:LysR family transcriptional regulator n=1 Tax=Labrys sp. KNU-23 TaxID=2789216 RepID=UPI0011F08EB5|nr:LysR family transcriptional regulator [Labrys sp. KNU-23]QEN88779.1 LysR family transcriptional regulator [Labrys sp. KNU-23]